MLKTKIVTDDIDSIIKVQCRFCAVETNHKVLHSAITFDDNPDNDAFERSKTIQCNGCEDISFQKIYWETSDGYYEVNGQYFPDSNHKLYPHRLPERKSLSNQLWKAQAPIRINTIYREIYEAYCNRQHNLCAAGLRMLLEQICIDCKATGTNLEKRITKLKEIDRCSGADEARLQGMRLFGNEVIHSMEPSREELDEGLDAIEHLLNAIYIVPASTTRLEKRHTQNINKNK